MHIKMADAIEGNAVKMEVVLDDFLRNGLDMTERTFVYSLGEENELFNKLRKD